MLNNSAKGEFVYEPFMGSGTTLIAAETIGRICLGVELNPVYVDVAIQRWQAFMGQSAILLTAAEEPDDAQQVQASSYEAQLIPGADFTGKTFEQIATLRLARSSSQSIAEDRTKAASREKPQEHDDRHGPASSKVATASNSTQHPKQT